VHLGVALAIAVVFLLAAAAVWLGRRLLTRSVAGLDLVSAENRAMVEARARQVINALTFVAYGAAAVASVSWALSEIGVGAPAWRPRDLAMWAMTHGLRIAAVVAGAFITLRTTHLVIAQLEYKAARTVTGSADPERLRRAATISGIASKLIASVIWAIAGLIVLRELSIDVVPILTGAGIAGLALGLGAQNMVRDLIAGFFMILEDQVRIGDQVRVNGVAGSVQEINLRTTVLRDVEGAVHVFSNGAITTLANLSKDFAYAIVDVGIAREADLDEAMTVLREIGSAMQRDPAFAPVLLAPIEVLGIEAMGATRVTIRTRFKAMPLKHGDVARELRRRIVAEFGARGIAGGG